MTDLQNLDDLQALVGKIQALNERLEDAIQREDEWIMLSRDEIQVSHSMIALLKQITSGGRVANAPSQ